ncbi:MAG: folate-binding protein [Pseudomonadota bacterium]
MTISWQQHLLDNGAHLDDDDVAENFGQPEFEQQAAVDGHVLCDLSHWALLEISGSDAAEFLQGQFTNDVELVDTTHSQMTAWCSAKGRVLVTMRLFKRDESYCILLPHDSLATVQKRLQMYVLRSDVKIQDRSDELPRIGVSGPEAHVIVAGLSTELPEDVDEVITENGITALRLPGPYPRYVFVAEVEPLLEVWNMLSQQVQPAGTDAWRLLDILVGIPEVGSDTADEYVPQMLNWHWLGGVSFDKGCYVGQEIIARTQYRGTLKRALYTAYIDTENYPEPNADVYAAGATAGKIVNAQAMDAGSCAVLAVLQIEVVDDELPLNLEHPDGPELMLQLLPYETGEIE